MDDESKGTEESEGYKYSSKIEELSVDENNKKWCDFCSNTGCVQKTIEQAIVDWGF